MKYYFIYSVRHLHLLTVPLFIILFVAASLIICTYLVKRALKTKIEKLVVFIKFVHLKNGKSNLEEAPVAGFCAYICSFFLDNQICNISSGFNNFKLLFSFFSFILRRRFVSVQVLVNERRSLKVPRAKLL